MSRSCVMCAATLALVLTVAAGGAAQAAGGWPALVSDQTASEVGDSLMVIINQTASASNSAQRGTRKATQLSGQASTGPRSLHKADLSMAGAFNGAGQTSRTDQILAAISVTVVGVRPNGDLLVAGEQRLLVNGENTVIQVSGRVRPADIVEPNTVLSSRLADAEIRYDGAGFGARAARPGLVGRVLDRLGLF